MFGKKHGGEQDKTKTKGGEEKLSLQNGVNRGKKKL